MASGRSELLENLERFVWTVRPCKCPTGKQPGCTVRITVAADLPGWHLAHFVADAAAPDPIAGMRQYPGDPYSGKVALIQVAVLQYLPAVLRDFHINQQCRRIVATAAVACAAGFQMLFVRLPGLVCSFVNSTEQGLWHGNQLDYGPVRHSVLQNGFHQKQPAPTPCAASWLRASAPCRFISARVVSITCCWNGLV